MELGEEVVAIFRICGSTRFNFQYRVKKILVIESSGISTGKLAFLASEGSLKCDHFRTQVVESGDFWTNREEIA